MRKTTEVDQENFSEHIGLRFKPAAHAALKKWAKVHNLPPAIFVRQLILNKIDELEKAKKVN